MPLVPAKCPKCGGDYRGVLHKTCSKCGYKNRKKSSF